MKGSSRWPQKARSLPQMRWCGTLIDIPHCSPDSSGAHYGQPACLHAIPDNGELSIQPRRFPIARNIIRNMSGEREKGWEEVGKQETVAAPRLLISKYVRLQANLHRTHGWRRGLAMWVYFVETTVPEYQVKDTTLVWKSWSGHFLPGFIMSQGCMVCVGKKNIG